MSIPKVVLLSLLTAIAAAGFVFLLDSYGIRVCPKPASLAHSALV